MRYATFVQSALIIGVEILVAFESYLTRTDVEAGAIWDRWPQAYSPPQDVTCDL